MHMRPAAPWNHKLRGFGYSRPPWRTLFIAAITAALILLSLAGCTTTRTESVRVDQTDRRTAVSTEKPDTVFVDSLRVDTLWMPGKVVTVPETVEVARREPTPEDTANAFPLQRITVDSAQVRLTGLQEQYSLAHPCFGERLIGNSEGGELSFYVEGKCVSRDTTIQVVYEQQSWLDRTVDRLARWVSLVALLGVGLYILWGLISTTIRSALPW